MLRENYTVIIIILSSKVKENLKNLWKILSRESIFWDWNHGLLYYVLQHSDWQKRRSKT